MSPKEDNNASNYRIVRSETFRRWLSNLVDQRAAARIAVRIDRLAEGNLGDRKSVGGGISELRVDVGKGYRVYFTIRRRTVVVLLVGGDKASQAKDIEKARKMADDL